MNSERTFEFLLRNLQIASKSALLVFALIESLCRNSISQFSETCNFTLLACKLFCSFLRFMKSEAHFSISCNKWQRNKMEKSRNPHTYSCNKRMHIHAQLTLNPFSVLEKNLCKTECELLWNRVVLCFFGYLILICGWYVLAMHRIERGEKIKRSNGKK